jgi:hypothetical protein
MSVLLNLIEPSLGFHDVRLQPIQLIEGEIPSHTLTGAACQRN